VGKSLTSHFITLCRFHRSGSTIKVQGDLVWFNDISYPKDTKTNFLITKSNDEGRQPSYYTLYTLYFFLQKLLLDHNSYQSQCQRLGVEPVRRADRNSLMVTTIYELRTRVFLLYYNLH
jgi:hypothetical protein